MLYAHADARPHANAHAHATWTWTWTWTWTHMSSYACRCSSCRSYSCLSTSHQADPSNPTPLLTPYPYPHPNPTPNLTPTPQPNPHPNPHPTPYPHTLLLHPIPSNQMRRIHRLLLLQCRHPSPRPYARSPRRAGARAYILYTRIRRVGCKCMHSAQCRLGGWVACAPRIYTAWAPHKHTALTLPMPMPMHMHMRRA